MARYRELRKQLMKHGFIYQRNSKGSHERWIHPVTGVFTTLTRHPGDLKTGVEKSILKAIEESESIKGDKHE